MKPTILLLSAFCLLGCQDNSRTPDQLLGDISTSLADILQDNRSTRADALLRLGLPSAQFETDRILLYRVAPSENHRDVIVMTRSSEPPGSAPAWAPGSFSLVLVFDDAGVLRRHNIVPLATYTPPPR